MVDIDKIGSKFGTKIHFYSKYFKKLIKNELKMSKVSNSVQIAKMSQKV